MNTISLYLQFGISILTIFFLCIYWTFCMGLDYWKKKGIYFLQPKLFFGNIKDIVLLRKNEALVYQSLYEKLGDHAYGGIYLTNKPVLLIKDLELIKTVVVNNLGTFHNKGFTNENIAVINDNMFTFSGRKWRILQMNLLHALTSSKMKEKFSILHQLAEEMVVGMKKNAVRKETIEINEVLLNVFIESIGSYVFGLLINTIEKRNLIHYFSPKVIKPGLLNGLQVLSSYLMPWLCQTLEKFKNHDADHYFMKIISDIIKFRDENNVKEDDFLQYLIQLRNEEEIDMDKNILKEDSYFNKSIIKKALYKNEEDDIVWTDNLLAALCYEFFVAGVNYSSTITSFCMYELAVNPIIQENIRKEVDDVLLDYSGQITYEAVQKMMYMEQVLNETLRKYPSVTKLYKRTAKPFMLPQTDTEISKGVTILIPVYALHHDHKYYPDPEKFDPERFSSENKTRLPDFAYLPFGEGQTMCVGMKFVALQIKVVIAALVSKYKFCATQKTSIPIIFDSSVHCLSPKGGIWLQISER